VTDLPRVDYKGVAARRARYLAVLTTYAGKPVDGTVIRALKRVIVDTYDDSYADSVQQTVMQYTSEKLSTRTISLIASQLAARHNELARGPLERFRIANVNQEWVPLEILGLQQAVWRDTKPGIQLKLECLAGTPAGHVFDRKLPLNWLNYLAYQIGFTRRMPYPDDRFWLFEGLRFWGSMVKLDERDELDFVDFSVDSNMKKLNKEILKLRLRYDIESDVECPRGFEHECSSCQVSCHECPAAPRHALPLVQMAAMPANP
jgi:hypothetical protein